MNVLLADAKKLLKEEIKGKSSYDKFMNLINPMDKKINQNLSQTVSNSESAPLSSIYLISLQSRLNDIKFDLRSLKREVSDNSGTIDFSNIDTYDDYAIEDIFKNTHILMETLKSLNH